MNANDERQAPGALSNRREQRVIHTSQTTNLAEVLERVLDKGIVIAGDITLFLAEVELLTIRVRLLVSSIDKAQEIGINWWQSDPAFSSHARQMEEENRLLRERLDRLENRFIESSDAKLQPIFLTLEHDKSLGKARESGGISPRLLLCLTVHFPAASTVWRPGA
ncbi:MAG TPA: gas vesicle protein [Ktedonobacterales bacterium]|nr:gas vesicle protein [Ktedonobacterales bacterium]